MKTHQITAFIIFFLITTLAFGQGKTINTKKSTLSWTGKAAFNAYALTGTLNVKQGSIVINNDSIVAMTIVIDMKSLDHDNSDLKKHLRSKDFFEVNTYKEATFKVSKAFEITDGMATVTGEMMIKDISKTETFILRFDTNYTALNFDISIDRTAYGVKFNSPSFFKKMKENAIADTFKLKGNLILE